MVTPDLIAVSDAGRAILACCQTNSSNNQKEEGKGKYNNFWNAFGITSKLEKMQAQKIQQNSGTQLLVKILQERKKVETVLMKAEQREGELLVLLRDKLVKARTLPAQQLEHQGLLGQGLVSVRQGRQAADIVGILQASECLSVELAAGSD